MERAKFAKTGMGPELSEFAFLPRKTVGFLSNHLNCGGPETYSILHNSWKTAFETGLIVDDGDRVSFPIWETPTTSEVGELPPNDLVAVLEPNHLEEGPAAGKGWALIYAGMDKWGSLRRLEDEDAMPRNLYDFAYIPLDTALPEIAQKALREDWGSGDDRYGILNSYLTYTYQRLVLQGEVFVDAREGFAAFNTGLVNDRYKDLFLCFGFNNRHHPAWRYEGICYAGERGLGKRLVDLCPQLPARATYFEDVNDLIYDISRELHVDYEHILFDNISRLPPACIRRQIHDRPELLVLLDALEREEIGPEGWEPLAAAIESDQEIAQRLLDKLESAVMLAEKRTQWNYRTAVPYYYPRANEMSMLLPLCMQDPPTPDVALVVSMTSSGNYQGETILTLEQAYMNARLICKPENDWLTP